MKLPPILYTISNHIKKLGGNTIVVGGAVRDYFLNISSKDYDIEVYNLPDQTTLEQLLSRYGDVDLVGKSFGVIKLTHNKIQYDFSFPRIETKISSGHKGFNIQLNHTIPYKFGAIRRDFTINSIGYDIENKKFLDPFGGIDDINKKILKHINDTTFQDDPLRVYRAIQFCSRFNLSIYPDTFGLLKQLVENDKLLELPKERIYEEFKKLLLKSSKPSVGLDLLKKLNIIKHFESLELLVKQNLWEQSSKSVDCIVPYLNFDNKINLKLTFAMLLHKLNETHIYKFMGKLTSQKKFIDAIISLVNNYHKVDIAYQHKNNNSYIKKLSTKVNLKEIAIIAYGAFCARQSISTIYKPKQWLLQEGEKLGILNNPPQPFINGKELIKLGFTPSKKFKIILEQLYKAQLDNKINSKQEAIDYLAQL